MRSNRPDAEEPPVKPGDDAFVAAMASVRSWLLLFGAVACFYAFLAINPYVGAVALVLLLFLQPPVGTTLRWDYWRPGKWWPTMAIYVPFVLVWLVLVVGYLRLVESLGHRVEPQELLVTFVSGGLAESVFWTQVILAVILAPVCEEIVFRGYLFRALATTLPIWGTQLVTATLFGLVHGVGHALPIGVLSLLFGYLRQRYGSLWPSILAHSVHNGVTLLLACSWPSLLDQLYNR